MDETPDATALMEQCSQSDVQRQAIQDCAETRGRDLEIANAKQTPSHPGVPYVVVDGTPLDDPLKVKDAICARLGDLGIPLPDSCDKTEGIIM